jgi:hypothetical protein
MNHSPVPNCDDSGVATVAARDIEEDEELTLRPPLVRPRVSRGRPRHLPRPEADRSHGLTRSPATRPPSVRRGSRPRSG